jgi:hypothetical protein
LPFDEAGSDLQALCEKQKHGAEGVTAELYYLIFVSK